MAGLRGEAAIVGRGRFAPQRNPIQDQQLAGTYVESYVSGMKVISATKARQSLYRLIDEVSDSREPLQISGPRSDVVLISAEEWRGIEDTLYLLSIPGMRESILASKTEPLDECMEQLDW